jgi:hypothetical protein
MKHHPGVRDLRGCPNDSDPGTPSNVLLFPNRMDNREPYVEASS